MRKSKKDTLPKNMTIEEASEFWDKHSIFEFEGVEEVDVKFDLRKKHYVGINRKVFEKLETYAEKSDIDVETLIESWITEKMSELEIGQKT